MDCIGAERAGGGGRMDGGGGGGTYSPYAVRRGSPGGTGGSIGAL